MSMWNVHLEFALPHAVTVEQLGHAGVALAGYDGAVKLVDGALHLDLSVEACRAVDAETRAFVGATQALHPLIGGLLATAISSK